MNQALALSPDPSPARGRGENTHRDANAGRGKSTDRGANAGKGKSTHRGANAGKGKSTDGNSKAVGLLPSPACGRGAGGEGQRLSKHQFAIELRSHQTTAEERLWYFLRAHRFMGLKFKRQKPLGPYIADFICMEYGLIVEADGGQHGSLGDFDRDVWLKKQGYTVLRFWNNQIHGEIDAVLEAIRQAVLAKGFVDTPALSPDPSPARGRGENTHRNVNDGRGENTHRNVNAGRGENTHRDVNAGRGENTHRDVNAGRGENTHRDVNAGRGESTHRDANVGRGENTDGNSKAAGLLPSPACGRGAGGEGQRIQSPTTP